MDPAAWNALAEVLVLFLVLSVIFEVALNSVFNWRVFIKHCEGKGWKTPIAFGAALVTFWTFDLDIISQVLNAFKAGGHGDHTVHFGGQILTALLIAGGSDSIFRIFKRLKLRDPTERREKAAAARDGGAG